MSRIFTLILVSYLENYKANNTCMLILLKYNGIKKQPTDLYFVTVSIDTYSCTKMGSYDISEPTSEIKRTVVTTLEPTVH